MAYAYFAGGCFWCITPPFRDLPGVIDVTSGYCGGEETAPAYADVKAQRTGHRETVRVEYDPEQVTFSVLLDTLLANVDPFDGGGQFIDRGHSYTLAVYYETPGEEAAARERLARLGAEGRTSAVAVEPLRAFWPAEEYHQDYDLKNPEAFAEELRTSGRKKQ